MTPLIGETQSALTSEWRRLTRVATFIAVLTSPSVFYWYDERDHWGFWWSLVATFATLLFVPCVFALLHRKHSTAGEVT